MARTQRELTDAQWAKLAPLLPPQRPRMGRPPKDHRLIVEAMVWLDRTGAPWRDLPAEYGPWETVASRFYRWRRRGIWGRVLRALQTDADARGELDWLLHYVDGSVVRAHQHAAGARRRPATADLDGQDTGAPADPDQPGDREALGRSRGLKGNRDPGQLRGKVTEGGPHGYDGAKRLDGRKRHLLVDTLGLLAVHMTGRRRQ